MGEYMKRSEYISRDAAIKSTWMILEGMGYPRSENRSLERTVEAVFQSAPAADVVEVVRCGECKYYNDKLEMYSDYVCTIRHYCDGSPIIVGKDDFCSSGRRKDGGQDDGI